MRACFLSRAYVDFGWASLIVLARTQLLQQAVVGRPNGTRALLRTLLAEGIHKRAVTVAAKDADAVDQAEAPHAVEELAGELVGEGRSTDIEGRGRLGVDSRGPYAYECDLTPSLLASRLLCTHAYVDACTLRLHTCKSHTGYLHEVYVSL